MNIFKAFASLEYVGEVDMEYTSSRRELMAQFLKYGRKAGLAILPVFLGKAYGQTTTVDPAIEALNLSLANGYLQFHLYNNAIENSSKLIPDAMKPSIIRLRDQKQSHINILIKAVESVGGTPLSAMPYSAFNYARISANVNTDLNIFLRTAMLIEDLGVRTCKGALPEVMGHVEALAPLIRIHTVLARHAAYIRISINGLQISNFKQLRPWQSNRRTDAGVVDDTNYNDSTVGAYSTIYYRDNATLQNAENKTTQGGVQIRGINGVTDITATAAAEAFDEYLLPVTAKGVANNLFINTGFKLS